MSVAAIIILRRKRFIRLFRELGVTSLDRTIPLSRIGMRKVVDFRSVGFSGRVHGSWE
jgi:hypothetical protein